MQKSVKLSLVCALLMSTSGLVAQGLSSKVVNAGVGLSNWGIPVFANMEIPINAANQSVVAGISYRYKRTPFVFSNYNSRWRHHIFGVEAGWNYYFDELAELPKEFDVSGGLRLGYYRFNSKLINPIDGFDGVYSGNESELELRIVIAGRYHFQPDKSLFVELGGGNVESGLRLGVSINI